MTDLDLVAIKARADAATEGPLYSESNEYNDAFNLANQPGKWDISETEVYLECDPTDAAFITAAYTDIPALIAEIERLRAAVGQETPNESHDLVIGAGDEELWIKCSCGWVVNPSPWPQTKPLEEAWEAWYWPHAIKEHIKQEETQ